MAADVVWLDALVTNPDRTAAEPEPARLARPAVADRPRRGAVHPPHLARPRRARRDGRSSGSRDHVLLPYAGSIDEADARLAPRHRRGLLADLVAALPDAWLPDDPVVGDAGGQRARVRPLSRPRLEAPREFVEEAERARRAA